MNFEQRKHFLEAVIEKTEQALIIAPPGKLRCAKHKNRISYFVVESKSGDTKGTYIRKDKKSLAAALAQKDYDRKVIKTAESELKAIRVLLKYNICEKVEDVYEKLNAYRKPLVKPVVLPKQDYAEAWQNRPFTTKGGASESQKHKTIKGELVRSKSEVLIANELLRQNIPYRYECPLNLSGFGLIHPDFTVLNVNKRKEYYWEHLGKMDDPGYINSLIPRLEAYMKNGIYPGERLILSFETGMYPLHAELIQGLIDRYLKQ